MKAYIIHHDQSTERKQIVQDLQKKTGAIIVNACWFPDHEKGCTLSHLKVALHAKKNAPDESYIVFEDDCELLEDTKMIFSKFSAADVFYLGYNDVGRNEKGDKLIFGTHALMISPKARELLLNYEDIFSKPFDHALSELCTKEKLHVVYPEYDKREAYARQKKDIISTITGYPRK